MRKTISFILCFVFIFTVFGVPKETAAAVDYSNVRVLLTMGSPASFTMAVTGTYFLNENGATFKGGTLTLRNAGGKVQVTHSSAGLIYTGSSVNIMREKIDPTAGHMRFVAGGVTRNFLGHFRVSASGAGLRVVNTVPLPHYLYGVVRGEMSNSFPLEALKAQAVAAKCYVLSGMKGGSDYDIGDTASDQVYKGYVATETNVHRAVDATYDVWLMLGNNILKAYYAASNGGITQLPSDVWTGAERYTWDRAYEKGTIDPYDLANPETMQEAALLPYDGDNNRNIAPALSRFLRLLAQYALTQNGQLGASDQVTYIDSIRDFKVYYGTEYSYASAAARKSNCEIDMAVVLNGNNLVRVSFPFDVFLFSYNGVWTNQVSSSLRLVTVTQQQGGFYVFHGRYGHGVGLSQRGAQQMAVQGKRYDEILRFYYPGATLQSFGVAPPTDPKKPSGGVNIGEDPDTQNTDAPATTTPIGGGATARVMVNMSEIRTKAGGGTIVALAPASVVVNVLGEESSYYYISVQGYSGYMKKSELQIVNAGSISPSNPSTSKNIIGTGQTTGTVNFRTGASTSTSIITQLKSGVKFNIYGKSGDWYNVEVNGREGYLFTTYVKETGGAGNSGDANGSGGASAGGAAITAYGETSASVNFRTSPSTSSSATIIKKLNKGTKLNIYSKSGNWYYVNADGKDGYISADYVKLTSSAGTSAAPGNTSGKTVTAYGETTGKVNFRTAPTTSGSTVLRQLARGTKVNIYSRSGDWYHVEAGGTEGYLSASLVKQTGIASGSGTNSTSSSASNGGVQSWTGVVVNEWVWLRSEATSNSSALAQLPVGTELTVYSKAGDFYKVNVNGQDGYAHMSYVNILRENTGGASSNAPATGKTGVTTTAVRLRSSPSTSTSTNILSMLGAGTPLIIHGDNGYGWYDVTAGGQRGYVSGLYVKLT